MRRCQVFLFLLLLFIFLFSLIHLLVKIRFPCESELQMHHLKLLSFFLFSTSIWRISLFIIRRFPFLLLVWMQSEKKAREKERNNFEPWFIIFAFCYVRGWQLLKRQVWVVMHHAFTSEKGFLKTPPFWPWKVLFTIEACFNSNKGLIHDIRLMLQEKSGPVCRPGRCCSSLITSCPYWTKKSQAKAGGGMA